MRLTHYINVTITDVIRFMSSVCGIVKKIQKQFHMKIKWQSVVPFLYIERKYHKK